MIDVRDPFLGLTVLEVRSEVTFMPGLDGYSCIHSEIEVSHQEQQLIIISFLLYGIQDMTEILLSLLFFLLTRREVTIEESERCRTDSHRDGYRSLVSHQTVEPSFNGRALDIRDNGDKANTGKDCDGGSN